MVSKFSFVLWVQAWSSGRIRWFNTVKIKYFLGHNVLTSCFFFHFHKIPFIMVRNTSNAE